MDSSLAFVTPEIIATEVDVIENFYKEVPELRKYERFLHNILRKREHTLSKEAEGLIASAGEVLEGPSNIFSMFNNADIKFPEITDDEGNKVRITHGNYVTFMESKNRDVREAAFKARYEG